MVGHVDAECSEDQTPPEDLTTETPHVMARADFDPPHTGPPFAEDHDGSLPLAARPCTR